VSEVPTQPLAGAVVVSIEQAVAAPLATRHLADLGARVIKVERPDGGDFARRYDSTVRGLSAYFVWANRSKESITLNLKDQRAREILRSLTDRADVYVQNLAPGLAESWGLSGAELRRSRPALVTCDISGYGVGGPMANRKAYDLMIQAEVGFLDVTGTPEERSKAGISIADIAAAMYAYSGILGALYLQSRTGIGSCLEVSLLDSLAEWMSMPLYYSHYGGQPPLRTGASHATIAPYGPFLLAAGGPLLIGIQNEAEWNRFCGDVLTLPDLFLDKRFATNAKRVENSAKLRSLIEGVLTTLTEEEAVRRLTDAKIAYGHVSSIGEMWEHPQLRNRNRYMEVESPAGQIEMLRPPVAFSEEPMCGPIPGLGDDTEAILEEIGVTASERDELRNAGVC
jgi:itaconate CoA-transferase